ncbi:MAG: 5-formyltetrahydrofolate cyclo-ligase [Shewanella sp.]
MDKPADLDASPKHHSICKLAVNSAKSLPLPPANTTTAPTDKSQQQSLRQSLRQNLKQARAALSPEQQAQSAKQAAHLALELITRLCAQEVNIQAVSIQTASSQTVTIPTINEPRPIKRIALYHTLGSELNTLPLIDLLRQYLPECELYLPRLHPFCAGHLLFLRYSKESKMTRNQFGIAEPKLDCREVMAASKLDIILTPLVGFDRQGQRMGMGGGYYDRTLVNSQAITIGFAHQVQQVESLPVEVWDQGLDYVVTPSEVHDFTQS